MNINVVIIFACLYNAILFSMNQQMNLTSKFARDQIQAIRCMVIIEFPMLFARKDYVTLERLTFERAKDMNMQHKNSYYLIKVSELMSSKTQSPRGNITQDIASYYGKYSEDPSDLPDTIKRHKEYLRYNSDSHPTHESMGQTNKPVIRFRNTNRNT